jgi:hypothetical protein
MPTEYNMDFRPSGVFIAGRSLIDSTPQIARTASSLYLCISQVCTVFLCNLLSAPNSVKTVILALRPVLFHRALSNCERCNEAQGEHSRIMKQLADICIRAASRCLVILQELRKHDILGESSRINPLLSQQSTPIAFGFFEAGN